MEAQNINLVVVTSVVHPYLPSKYTANERFEQLISLTIPSIKKKIPNHYIVVVEGSSLSKEQINFLKNQGINDLLFVDIKNYEKSYGELSLLVKYFQSTFFKNLLKNKNILTVNKISGRYFLTDNYDFFKHPVDKVLIKKYDKSEWTNMGICDTRYYRFPFSLFPKYFETLNKILEQGIFIDLEHSFYNYKVFDFNNIENVDIINLSGNLAPDGKEILD